MDANVINQTTDNEKIVNTEKFSYKYKIINNKLIIDFNFDLYRHELYNKELTISILNRAYNNQINMPKSMIKNSIIGGLLQNTKIIYEKTFLIGNQKKQLIIDLNDMENFSYNGYNFSIENVLSIDIKDSSLLNTKSESVLNLGFLKKSDIYNYNYLSVDNFNILKSLKVLKVHQICILLINLFILIINFLNVLNDKIIFLDLSKFNIIIDPIIFIFGFSFFITYLIISLKSYVKIKYNNFLSNGDIKNEYTIGDLFTINSNKEINNVKIRLIAYNKENLEKYNYITNNTVIFEETIPYLPKGKNIQDIIKGKFTLDELYKKLYPNYDINNRYIINIKLRLEIINNDYLDVAEEYYIDSLNFKDFCKYH